MKKHHGPILATILLLGLFITGCTSLNPFHVAGDASTPAYVADTNAPAKIAVVQGYVAQAGAIAGTLYPPAAPISSAANEVLGAVAGIITGASLLVARLKSNSAAKHEAAAAALATTVVAGGLQSTAASNAAANGSSQLVAQHVADATNPVQL